MNDNIETLADALPREIKRCTDLVRAYRELPGGAGAFGAVMIQADIDAAIKAMADSDVAAMLRAYKALEGSK